MCAPAQRPPGVDRARQKMKAHVVLRRFLMPPALVALLAYLKFGAHVSPRAEVEFSSWLDLGKDSIVAPFAKIKASQGPIAIGARVRIGSGTSIGGHVHGIRIGDDCVIGPRVAIVGVNYRYERIDIATRLQGLVSAGPIVIGAGTVIEAGAVILDGTWIGEGALVAANAVVSGVVAAGAIVRGNPARPIWPGGIGSTGESLRCVGIGG
jgi:acetyltransferase-like isoleucine patch superfamily enzyme